MSELKTAKFVGGFERQAESAIYNGVITVACPFCATQQTIEPDGFCDDILCEGCGEHYKTVGII